MNETTTTEIKLSRWYKRTMFFVLMLGFMVMVHTIMNTPSPWNWVWCAFLVVVAVAGTPYRMDDPVDPLKNFKIKQNQIRVIHIHENLVILLRLISLLVVWPSMLWVVYVAYLSRTN